MIKTIQLEDLVGKTIEIRSFSDEGVELIIGRDIASGERYLLKEIHYPILENCKEKNPCKPTSSE